MNIAQIKHYGEKDKIDTLVTMGKISFANRLNSACRSDRV